MRIEAILRCLETAQANIAKDAMERPATELFEHGRTIGVYHGFTLAKEALLAFYNEEDERKNRF